MHRPTAVLLISMLVAGCTTTATGPGTSLSRPSSPEPPSDGGIPQIKPQVPVQDAVVEAPDSTVRETPGLENRRPFVEDVAMAAEPRVGSVERPFTLEYVRELLSSMEPPGRWFVDIDGAPLALLADVEADGTPEVFCLSVNAGAAETEAATLGDYGRLFDADAGDPDYRLEVYRQTPGGLSPFTSAELGAWRVFGSFSVRSLSTTGPSPVAVMCEFQTASATEHVWIVPDSRTRRADTVLRLTQTVSMEPLVQDIDGDAILDIVTREQVLESGGRVETYLTWYRWNGRTFEEQASTTVVRNLVGFLTSVRTLVFEGDPGRLVSYAVASDAADALRREDLDDEGIILRVLGMEEGKDILNNIRDIIFPEIREDPFGRSDEVGSPFDLAIRVIDAQGRSSFARAVIYMLRNPFAERQFAFYPADLR